MSELVSEAETWSTTQVADLTSQVPISVRKRTAIEANGNTSERQAEVEEDATSDEEIRRRSATDVKSLCWSLNETG